MRMTQWAWLCTFSILSILSIVVSLCIGSTSIPMKLLFSSLIHHTDPIIQQIFFDLRLPRTLSAFITGGLLALAGSLMQVLLRNPLADPYALGISGGAAIFSMLFILVGCSLPWIVTGAWLGSLLSFLFIYTLNRKQFSKDKVLLTGIALASGFSALLSFMLIVSNDKELHSILFWLLGDLSRAHLPIIECVILILGCIMSCILAPQLNIFVQGEFFAESLGIPPVQLKIQLYLLSSLLTAAACALAGTIGFIGLVVPHLFRLLCGFDHRFLLPGSVLLGGTLLTCADTMARSLFSPQQLPVGIMTALLGIPVMLILLQKSRT